MATAMQERFEAAERPSGRPFAVEATRLDDDVPARPTTLATAAGTP